MIGISLRPSRIQNRVPSSQPAMFWYITLSSTNLLQFASEQNKISYNLYLRVHLMTGNKIFVIHQPFDVQQFLYSTHFKYLTCEFSPWPLWIKSPITLKSETLDESNCVIKGVLISALPMHTMIYDLHRVITCQKFTGSTVTTKWPFQFLNPPP